MDANVKCYTNTWLVVGYLVRRLDYESFGTNKVKSNIFIVFFFYFCLLLEIAH